MVTSQQATVIIPCFNVADYIEDCLDSVLLQGDSVHETYVVDNNSTDNTMEVVRAWHHAHPTFPLYLLEEKKPGAPAARNRPLQLVKTYWVQFLDADDLLLKNKIEAQVTLFPNAHVICAGAIYMALDGAQNISTPEPNIPLALIKSEAGITSSNLFSTFHLRNIQGWNETLKSSQEYDLMFRLWRSGATFAVDSETRACIRERPSGQISKRNPTKKWVQLLTLREEMLSTMISMNEQIITDEQPFYQALFDQIRTLAKYDRKEAVKFFNRLLENKNFKPTPNGVNSRIYIVVFNLFGFQAAEIIKKFGAFLFNKKP